MDPQKIYEKFYKNNIPITEYYSLINHDPTRIEKDGETIKCGKYTKWILTKYAYFYYNNIDNFLEIKKIHFEDLQKLEYYLDLFNRYKGIIPIESRDILKYSSLSKLYTIIKRFDIKDGNNINIFDHITENLDYRLMESIQNFNIYIPLTEKGASVLGVNSQWCTSYGKYSLNKKHTKMSNHFSTYCDDNLYILINNSNPKIKYQFYFKTNMYMDVNDKPVLQLDKFNKFILYIIKNGYFLPKFNILTKNNTIISLYNKELDKKLADIKSIDDYLSKYLMNNDKIYSEIVEYIFFSKLIQNINLEILIKLHVKYGQNVNNSFFIFLIKKINLVESDADLFNLYKPNFNKLLCKAINNKIQKYL